MRTTLAAAATAVAVISLAGCHKQPERAKPVPPDEAAELLGERLWLDHAPRGERDRFHLALFDPSGIGIVQERTIWKGDFEMFLHEADDGRIELVRPASGEQVTTGFHIEPTRTREGADYKLILEHNPFGPREYLGFGGDGASPDAWLARRFGGAGGAGR